MAKKSGYDKFAEDLQKALKQSKEKTVDALKLLKFHKKRDKFSLTYLKNYMSKKDYRDISAKIKQGKAKVKIERKGYSFLISGRDLLPVVKSKHLPTEEVNKLIEHRFFAEKYADFSQRAWKVLPEYIGSRIPANKDVKTVLALGLFSDVKMNIRDESNVSKRLVAHAKLIGKIKAKASKKDDESYEVNFLAKPAKLGKFEAITNRASKVAHLRRGDIDFIKKYVEEGKKIEITISRNFRKKFRRETLRELAKASARIELRKEVAKKDIERIKALGL